MLVRKRPGGRQDEFSIVRSRRDGASNGIDSVGLARGDSGSGGFIVGRVYLGLPFLGVLESLW